ncbi:MAG: hypothetical protein IPL56_12850 [Saprospiraceae bacterium]|nr:hypothetical protein [Saprospiraceae bacterium]
MTTGTWIYSNIINVVVKPLPIASINGITTICNGGITTLTASGGGSYLWSNNSTSTSINISPAITTGYSVTVTNNGCQATASQVVTVIPTPITPTLSGVSQPGCGGTTGSFTITNYNASYIYTISPSSGVSRSGSTITAPTGSYTVTATLGPCTSGSSLSATVNAAPTTPTTPTLSAVSQPGCGGTTGSFTITNYNASYVYTISPSSGVSRSGSTITAPTGSYAVTATLGSCTSGTSLSATVNSAPTTPTTPTLGAVNQPGCGGTTGSFTITNYNASYVYTISPSTGVSRSGSTITAPTGSYTVTATLGPCTSGSSLTATVNAAPTTPTTPTLSAVTQPGCGGTTGSFTITNYNASYIYTISPSTGVNRSGSTITAPTGSYTVTATLGPCTSGSSLSATVNAAPTTPTTPTLSAVTQPGCGGTTGSFTITNYNVTYSYTISPSSGVNRSGSTITAPTGSFTVTATLGLCTSGSSLSATVNSAPSTPTTPTLSAVSQPGCGGTNGSFTITNYNATYIYTISPSTGVNRSGSTITAPTGSYTVTATLGPCTSGSSLTATVNAAPTTPTTPTLSAVSQPGCGGTTGNFTITNYNASYIYIISPSSGVSRSGSTITAPTGSFTVTATLGPCTSGSSLSAIVNAAPTTPTTPTLSAVSQPGCGGTTGSFTITNYNATYSYTISPSSGVSRSGSTITAPTGSYAVTATLGSCTSGIITDRNCQFSTNHTNDTNLKCSEPTWLRWDHRKFYHHQLQCILCLYDKSFYRSEPIR